MIFQLKYFFRSGIGRIWGDGLSASYVERLLWIFFRDRVFGGFRVFVAKHVVPYTLATILVISTGLLLGPDPTYIIIPSLILIAFGAIFYRRPISMSMSISISTILVAVPLLSIIVKPYVFPSWAIVYVIYTLIFLWFILNSTMFIVQLCDFFASTGGLYLLLGSDRNRVFLYPIPIIVVSAYLLFIVWYMDMVFPDIVLALAPVIPILLIHSLAKGMGRPVRSALSIYTLSIIYPAIGFVVGFGRGNLAFWAVITIISTLFTAQQYARRAVAGRSTPTYLACLLLGFLLIICYIIGSQLGSLAEIYNIWLMLSAASLGLAPIISLLFIIASGRKEYYMERDRMGLPQLLKETIVILGAKFKDIMKDYLTRTLLSHLFGSKK